jgi:hypothetical protein
MHKQAEIMQSGNPLTTEFFNHRAIACIIYFIGGKKEDIFSTSLKTLHPGGI